MSSKPAVSNERLLQLVEEARKVIADQTAKIEASRHECERVKTLAMHAGKQIEKQKTKIADMEQQNAKLKKENAKLEQQNAKERAKTAEVEKENTRLLAIDTELKKMVDGYMGKGK